MNKFICVGRVAKEHKRIETKSGYFLRFCIACPRTYKGKDGKYGVDFFEIMSFTPHISDYLERFVKVGDSLYVEAELKKDSYMDKEGKKVYSLTIVASKTSTVAKSTKSLKEKDEIALASKSKNYTTKQVDEKLEEFLSEDEGQDEGVPF